MSTQSPPSLPDVRPAPVGPRTTEHLLHELNNQLTVVLGMSQWAGLSEDPALHRHALAGIERAAEAMARLLGEFPRDARDRETARHAGGAR